jgi:hypothetical protein
MERLRLSEVNGDADVPAATSSLPPRFSEVLPAQAAALIRPHCPNTRHRSGKNIQAIEARAGVFRLSNVVGRLAS